MSSSEQASHTTYADAYRESMDQPEKFWLDAARAVDWDVAPTKALDDSAAPIYRWFPDASLNTSFNALDRHVRDGRGDQTALIFDSAMVPTKATYTYAELLEQVSLFAGVLKDQGVVAGDRVIIYMPMIPEAAIAMLACARIGAVHSVVFGGFAAKELATRIDDAGPVVLVTASGGLEPGRTIEYLPMVEKALQLSATPAHTVIVKNREQIPGAASDYKSSAAAWFDWDELIADATPADPVSVAATDPLYILYTSGTTGKPKGVVRDNGGHAVALTWTMKNLYDTSPGQVWWTASDVAGWSATPTSSTDRCSPEPRRSCTKASPSAPPTPVRSGASFPNTTCRHSSPLRQRSARSARPTRTQKSLPSTTSRRSTHCSRPASAWIPTPTSGLLGFSIARWSITGGRPKPVGPSARTCAASNRWRSKQAHPPSPAPDTASKSSTARANSWVRAPRQHRDRPAASSRNTRRTVA